MLARTSGVAMPEHRARAVAGTKIRPLRAILELSDPDAWRESTLLTETESAAVLFEIRKTPEYEDFEQRRRDRERVTAEAAAHELKSGKFRRLMDTLENLLLARNLSLIASADIVARCEKMRALEGMTLRSK